MNKHKADMKLSGFLREKAACKPAKVLLPEGDAPRGREALVIDGEMQADAALVSWIGKNKSPGSPVEGKANVLVFPDLNSGNIAYKLVERLAGAKYLGPVVTGIEPPVNDLSRGCSAEDIVDICAISSIQASILKETQGER